MKKILFFLLVLFCIPFQIFGINGLGTYASPFNGPLTTDMNWSGTIYVNGDVVVSGYTLTVSTGATVIFVSAGANLIITGTGVLTASGSAGSMIRFTADFNNNGIYGEAGETWGHISFQSMTSGFTTPSTINYCIIEYGQKNASPFNVDATGGGIYTEFSFLTVSNSVIRNNFAGYGGGIFVTKSNPHLFNCTISNNTAGTTGGGMLFYISCPSVVENCIIYKNTCSGPGGAGGVFAGYEVGNLLFYNCDIVSNTSTNNSGNNIRLYSNSAAPYPKFQNCIIWGSDSWIQYISSPKLASNFTNCGLQSDAASYTACINLNGNNIDPAGPNFYNVTSGSEDYEIKYISPCRDAGISTGAPLTDYLGNGRVGPYDIGAYEDQYNTWKTTASSSSWSNAGNWTLGIPISLLQDVIIPNGAAFYPTGNPTQRFTLGTGKMMILNPGAQLSLGVLTNTSGTLRLLSDANGIASLNMGGYVDNGNDDIQLYLEGNTNGTLWHYVSPPFTSLSATTLGSSNSSIAKYEENLISNNMNNGWVTYNGYHYDITLTPAAWVQAGLNWPTLYAGSGYNYFSTANKTYDLQGTVNVSDVPVNLVFNSGGFTANQNEQGFNLIGNPFTCGLDWDGVVSANSTIFNVNNVETTIYFRLNGVTIYYNNGFTVPNTYNTDGSLLPPMQGFFIKTNANVTLNLPASAKTHTANKRYKGNSTAPHIRLQYENSVKSDQTVIYFDEKATLGFDKMLDGRKAFLTNSDPNIYSVIDGINYSINGIPFPKDSTTIPLVVNATSDGSYAIKATELVGLDSYKVFLNDKSQNLSINLANDSSYTFNATTGTLTDRFTLTITNVLTAIPENTVSVKPFNIYSSNGLVNIQTLSDIWNGKQGGVRVLDMTGRVFTTEDNVEFSKDNLLQIPVRAATGIYMVELRSGTLRYVGKVMIR
jgi:hypothetical protein